MIVEPGRTSSKLLAGRRPPFGNRDSLSYPMSVKWPCPRPEAVDAWLGMRGPSAEAMTPRQVHVSDHLGFQAVRKAQ